MRMRPPPASWRATALPSSRPVADCSPRWHCPASGRAPGSQDEETVVIAIRWVKTVMVASTALFALLVTLNNLVDYGSNYEFVRHTLSMDTTFPGNALMGRAMTSPAIWTVAYWLIILTEASVGVTLAIGAFRLVLAINGPATAFNAAKTMTIVG